MKNILPTLFLLLLFPNASTAFFRCLSQPTRRCGFLNLGVTARIGEPGESCVEACFYLVLDPYKCGTCGDSVTDDYDIALGFDGVPLEDTSVFIAAATRWESIVTKGLPAVATGNILPVTCDFPVVIDDLLVCVFYRDVDGLNGTIGSTSIFGSRITTFTTQVPFLAEITLDLADVSFLKERGFFASYVLRSMGRAMGIGTSWPGSGLTTGGSDTCIYTGTLASAEYQAISGCSGVAPPLYRNGTISFSPCVSWSEDCFGTELFSGVPFVGNQTAFPLSRMTIASLNDLGYTVDYSQADAFGKSDLNPSCTCGRRSLQATKVAKSPPPQRRLSPKGRQEAVLYGKRLLAEAQEKRDLSGRSGSDATVENERDQIATVFYMENDHIFDVVVRSNE